MPVIFAVVAAAITILALFVVGLSRHKKTASLPLNLIGATGIIESSLEPEGAVVISGELWRARAENGITMKARNQVRVVGVRAHLLLVVPISD